MKPKICKNCGHLEEEHRPNRQIKNICKHQRWDKVQGLFLSCKCTKFEEGIYFKNE